MKYKFVFEKGSVVADLDLATVLDLHGRLLAGYVSEEYGLELLRQIAFFNKNLEEITDQFGGSTVVIAREQVMTSGTTQEAFTWLSENYAYDPVYVAEVPMQSESDSAEANEAESPEEQLPIYDFTKPQMSRAAGAAKDLGWHRALAAPAQKRAGEVYDA